MRKTQARPLSRQASGTRGKQARAAKPGRPVGTGRPKRKKPTDTPEGNSWVKKPRAKSAGKPRQSPQPTTRNKQNQDEQSSPRRRQTKRPDQHAGPAVSEPMRIAKAMARAGLCSRREAERWIEDGRVKLNGKRLTTPAVEVGPKDRVLVDNEPLPLAEPTRLWRFHKPKGQVTTHNDPEGRPTVFDHLPKDLPRVISVGRLDFNTEGLLLLTNDGALARHLELPATGWLRRYRVRVHGRIAQKALDRLKDGIAIEGVRYGPIEATLDSQTGANSWLSLGLREGKNREVRKILSSLDLEVNRLIRVSYGPIQLLDLKPGQAELIRRKVLIDQLSKSIAEELGLTGDAPEDTSAKVPRARSQSNNRSSVEDKRRRPDKRATPAKDKRRRVPPKRSSASKPKPGKRT